MPSPMTSSPMVMTVSRFIVISSFALMVGIPFRFSHQELKPDDGVESRM
jgi:hypothetical protein